MHFRRLLSWRALLGWGLLFRFLWNAVGEIDTAMALPAVVDSVWDFLGSPWGNIVLLVLGLLWLAYLVTQPRWVPRLLRSVLSGDDGERDIADGRLTALEQEAPRWEKTEHTLRDLQTDFQLYKEAVRGEGYLQDGERLAAIEQRLDSITQRVGREPSFDPATTKGQIVITHKSASFLLGMIDRTMTLSFDVRNTSPIWVAPTFQTSGTLSFQATRMLSTRWTVWWPSETEIDPGGTKRLDLVFHVSDRFAESIAFYAAPGPGSFQIDLSELRVEFQARDREGVSASVGYLPVGEQLTVAVEDGRVTQQMRAYVNWRDDQFRN